MHAATVSFLVGCFVGSMSMFIWIKTKNTRKLKKEYKNLMRDIKDLNIQGF